MRFKHRDFDGHTEGPYTAEEAVAFQADKEARLCDGQLERLQARIDSLQGILGRLIDNMPVRGKGDAEELANVIGHAWELED